MLNVHNRTIVSIFFYKYYIYINIYLRKCNILILEFREQEETVSIFDTMFNSIILDFLLEYLHS